MEIQSSSVRATKRRKSNQGIQSCPDEAQIEVEIDRGLVMGKMKTSKVLARKELRKAHRQAAKEKKQQRHAKRAALKARRPAWICSNQSDAILPKLCNPLSSIMQVGTDVRYRPWLGYRTCLRISTRPPAEGLFLLKAPWTIQYKFQYYKLYRARGHIGTNKCILPILDDILMTKIQNTPYILLSSTY